MLHRIAMLLFLGLLAAAGCRPAKPMMSLHEAAKQGNREQVRANLYWKTDVNARDTHDYATALHYAAARGDLEMASTLIAAGADVNAEDSKYHGTPLQLAVANGHTAVADLLRRKGAKEPTPPPTPRAP